MKIRLGSACAASVFVFGFAVTAFAEDVRPTGSLGASPCAEADGCAHFQGYIYVHRGAQGGSSAGALWLRNDQAPAPRRDSLFVHLGDADAR